MNLSCNLYVDGEFEGSINSQNEVNIGKHEGTVNADRVEIKSAGRVSGTIEAAELVIESKGIFEGNSVVKDIKPLAASPKKVQITKE